jgi:hypothetical protein
MNASVHEIPDEIPDISIDRLHFHLLDDVDIGRGNKFFDSIKDGLVAFADKHGILLDNYKDYYEMASLLYPQATEEDLKLACEIMMVLFFVDETAGEEMNEANPRNLFGKVPGELINSLLLKLKKGDIEHGTNPVETSVFEIWPKLLKSAPRYFLDRFLRAVIQYLPQNVDLSEEHGNNEEVYRHYRIENSGMMPTILLIQLAMRMFISDELYNSGKFQALLESVEQCVALIGSLTNDICSFPKEVWDMKSKLNLIPVLMKEHNIPLTEAINLSIDRVNEELRIFVGLRTSILNKAAGTEHEEILTEYCKGLSYIVKATIVWQLLMTNRYKHARHIIRQLRFQKN